VTTTTTLSEIVTTWTATTKTYLQDAWYIGPSLDPYGSCWIRVTVVSAPVSVPSSGGVSEKAGQGVYLPEMLLAVVGLVAYGGAGRLKWLKKVSLVLTPYGLAVLLVVVVFMVGPVMEAVAQTITVTSTYYTTTYTTTTVTMTSTGYTTTVTSTTTRYEYTTKTVTSTIVHSKTCIRCGPFCGPPQSCQCVYEGSYPC
jgi:hypothetical protein